MKTKVLIMAILTFTMSGCVKFDDSHLWDSINSLNDRVERLEDICDRMNTNISSLQAIVQALKNNDAVTSVSSLPDGSGYTITFASGKVITIYNGTDGKDGEDGKDGMNGTDGQDGKTPIISIKQDVDGVYYWTVDGEWLIVDGQKVKAVGTDGKDGIDGQDGEDGKDGITPQFKIENGYWHISYDNGMSWIQLGKATGDNGLNGADGESLFKGVSIENGYICFILNDEESTIIKLPFVSETELSLSIEPGTLESRISEGQERTLLKLKLSGNVNDADIKYIRYYMTNLEYLDLSETQLTSIAPYAFEGMVRIKEIVFPQCCNNIGDNAFANCRILSSVYAPGATISASAITSCENLKRLECANIINGGIDMSNLELILMGDEDGKVTLPFKYDEMQTVMKVKKLVFGSTTTEITNTSKYAYNRIDATEIYFDPQSKISEIINGIFTKSGSLRKITFPISLTTLGDCAFYACPNLSEIIFPEDCMLKELRYNTRTREKSIFTETGVKEFSYPKNIETIAGNVFYGTEIETIIFPENNNYLQLTHGTYTSYDNTFNQYSYYDTGVFEDLKNLNTIKCYRMIPPVVTENAFNGLNEQFFYNCKLYVPSSAINNYKTDTYWSKFKNILPIE